MCLWQLFVHFTISLNFDSFQDPNVYNVKKTQAVYCSGALGREKVVCVWWRWFWFKKKSENMGWEMSMKGILLY